MNDKSGRLIIISMAIITFLIVSIAILSHFFMIAEIQSSSMEPTIEEGEKELIILENSPTVSYPDSVDGKYEIESNGDVIVFYPDGDESETPVIHRAIMYVEEDENWYDNHNISSESSNDSCLEIEYCPAPNSGFITKGDGNGYFDQEAGISKPVNESWIIGHIF